MSLAFDAQGSCDRCGRFGAFAFDGRSLCGDCYECSGACCPEGKEWERDADQAAGNDEAQRRPVAASATPTAEHSRAAPPVTRVSPSA